ncbi:MAG TPA: cation:proton antiporter [Acidimicrobiales bacterium]|nr:cation:proton antiporter [Acidimicrobiales bacterium]
MNNSDSFALLVLLISGVGLAAIFSNHVTAWIKIPAPALFLIAAAVAVKVFPTLHAPTLQAVVRVVTVALLFILFDGGMHIGWSRFRSAAGPIGVVGLPGTFLTVAAGAVLVHFAFHLAWYVALLVATAVAPTDPAVVFSVLGQREVSGRSGTILEGESGANDPVGIALMASLVTAGGFSSGTIGRVAGEFLIQMGVGASIGIVGGCALVWFIRHVPLPSEGLYPLRTAVGVLVLYGAATIAHGSGFLAVFLAGIVVGDIRAPYKREVERFHSALASLSEIIAFVVLGLTVNLTELSRVDVWVPGLVLGALLAFVIRPIMVGVCLIPAQLKRNERSFVLFAGLKGAVPLLLGISLLAAHVTGAPRLYGIVVVVVLFSVIVQGCLVPGAARLLGIPTRDVELEPWAIGVRLQDEPDAVHQLVVGTGSQVEGRTIGSLSDDAGDAWVSLVVRDGQLLPMSGTTILQAGDQVLIVGNGEVQDQLLEAFEER